MRRRSNATERLEVVAVEDPIWFETEDGGLRASLEAFAGLLLLPAMQAGVLVEVEAPLDATWVLGTRTLAGIYADWWGYPATHPYDLTPDLVRRDDTPPAPGHGLCFGGGVDSFYALFTASSRYDHLVFVHGYDIPLEDEGRMRAFERSLRDVARETRKRAVLLRTNVRQHPAFSSVPWERTHGAALAAAGHLLSDRLGTLSIPASWRRDRVQPSGTHPATDELWSSRRLQVRHGEAELSRQDRTLRIARYPLAQKHLRVCWENRAPAGNCSRCEKCLRTMLALVGAGALDLFETFDGRADLIAALDALPRVPPDTTQQWTDLYELDLAPDLRRAVERLLERSRPSWWQRLLGRG